jgi:hypothetical protein
VLVEFRNFLNRDLNKYDKIGSIFVLMCILFAIPTWYIHQIEDKRLHFYIWDISLLMTISLIPFMAYKIVRNRALKWFCLSYFYLTLTNLLSKHIQYYAFVDINILRVQIIGLIIILIWSITRIKKYGFY